MVWMRFTDNNDSNNDDDDDNGDDNDNNNNYYTNNKFIPFFLNIRVTCNLKKYFL